MNLNKYTKAELISKLKNKETKTNNVTVSKTNNIFENKEEPLLPILKSYFYEYLKIINIIKKYFLQLTLIGLIITIIRRFKFLKIILYLMESVTMFIMGLFTIDIWGYEYLKFIFDYFRDSKFYHFLEKLFSNHEIMNKEEIPSNRIENVSK